MLNLVRPQTDSALIQFGLNYNWLNGNLFLFNVEVAGFDLTKVNVGKKGDSGFSASIQFSLLSKNLGKSQTGHETKNKNLQCLFLHHIRLLYITFFKDDCGKNCVEENNKTKDGDTTDGDPACCEASTSRDDDSTEFLFNVKRKVEFCLVITYSITLIWFIQCLILCISVHEFSEFKISSRTSTA